MNDYKIDESLGGFAEEPNDVEDDYKIFNMGLAHEYINAFFAKILKV